MRKKQKALLTLVMAALAAVASVATGQESKFTYSGSLQYATGDYTLSETTNTFLLFSTFDYDSGRWRVSASIPLIYQDTPFVTYSGGAPVPTGRQHGVDPESGTSSDGARNTKGSGSGQGGIVEVPDPDTLDFDEFGVGDPVFRADFTITENKASSLEFGVYGAAKPPLADEESGFSTGAWDYGAGITLSREAGSTLLFADLGYWIFGDLPDYELEDPFAYSFGLGRPLGSGRYSGLVSVYGYTEIVDGVDGPVQAAFTLSRFVRSDRSLYLTLSAGLTESAADYAVSVGWRVEL